MKYPLKCSRTCLIHTIATTLRYIGLPTSGALGGSVGSPARPMQVEHIQTSDALNKAMCKDGGG